MNKTKFGVLGVSSHFLRRVAVPCSRSESVEIRAMASRDKTKAEKACGEFGIPLAFGDYASMVASSEIDAVYIALPNHLHAEWIRKCADAGKHVICEKPVTMNAAEAVDAAAYAGRKKVLLMEAFMYKFHPQWKHVHELVHTGDIGAVQSIHTTFFYNNPDPKNIRNIAEVGGGALMDIGCYAISIPRFLLGREPSRVQAFMTMDPVFKTDTLTTATMDFGDARATFTVGTKTAPFQRVYIHGTQGTIEVAVPVNTYYDVPAEVTITTTVGRRVHQAPMVNQYQLQFEEFALAMRNGQPSPVPADDAVNNMRVIDAVVRAHRSGGWENVE